MSELQNSLQSMGVMQYLLAVLFIICYALAIGGFLGPEARTGLAVTGLLSAGGFSVLADYWVHGVLLTAFAIVGMGGFIALSWLLKTVVQAGQRRSALAAGQLAQDAEVQDFSSAGEAAVPVGASSALPAEFRLAEEQGAIDHVR